MFDIDGTLTATSRVDTRCYAQAMSEHLGVAINTNWSDYRHVTDSGIAAEVFQAHHRSLKEISVVRERFVELIVGSLRALPECCVEVAGANSILQRLRTIPGVVLGLATGGWRESAEAKLRHAGIDVSGIELASADDAEARVDIMRSCRDRLLASDVMVSSVTYVGDGVWDAQASRILGWAFVGIGNGTRADRLREMGVGTIFEDYKDQIAFLSAVGAG